MPPNCPPPNPPRVFISYAWEDDDYKSRVEGLATRLRQDGIDARLDTWHTGGVTIPEFMNAEVRLADKILLIGSPKYREKVHAMEEGHKISGGGWESMLLTSAIWTGLKSRDDLVVVIFRGSWRDATPSFAAAMPSLDLTNDATFEDQYRQLLQRLLGQTKQPPAIGQPPSGLAPQTVPPLRALTPGVGPGNARSRSASPASVAPAPAHISPDGRDQELANLECTSKTDANLGQNRAIAMPPTEEVQATSRQGEPDAAPHSERAVETPEYLSGAATTSSRSFRMVQNACLLLGLILVGHAGYKWFASTRTTPGLKILLADFEPNADSSPYRITRTIESSLSSLSSRNFPVQVEMLGRQIPWRTSQGGEAAQFDYVVAQAKSRNAAMVIWGEVTTTSEMLTVTYHHYLFSTDWKPHGSMFRIGLPGGHSSLERLHVTDGLATSVVFNSVAMVASALGTSVKEREAITLLRMALGRPRHPSDLEFRANALDMLGQNLHRSEDVEGALKAYSEAIELGPKRKNSLVHRGVLLTGRQRYADAIADLATALTDKELPRELEVEARLSFGDALFFGSNDLQGARLQYDTAVALAPKNARALFNRGAMSQRLGDNAMAQRDFEAALALDPTLSKLRLGRRE